MNEKEANDIIFIAEGADGPLNRGEYGKMCHAHGYMEAIEKAKGLEHMLRKIAGSAAKGSEWVRRADVVDLLAKWEKEK